MSDKIAMIKNSTARTNLLVIIFICFSNSSFKELNADYWQGNPYIQANNLYPNYPNLSGIYDPQVYPRLSPRVSPHIRIQNTGPRNLFMPGPRQDFRYHEQFLPRQTYDYQERPFSMSTSNYPWRDRQWNSGQWGRGFPRFDRGYEYSDFGHYSRGRGSPFQRNIPKPPWLYGNQYKPYRHHSFPPQSFRSQEQMQERPKHLTLGVLQRLLTPISPFEYENRQYIVDNFLQGNYALLPELIKFLESRSNSVDIHSIVYKQDIDEFFNSKGVHCPKGSSSSGSRTIANQLSKLETTSLDKHYDDHCEPNSDDNKEKKTIPLAKTSKELLNDRLPSKDNQRQSDVANDGIGNEGFKLSSESTPKRASEQAGWTASPKLSSNNPTKSNQTKTSGKKTEESKTKPSTIKRSSTDQTLAIASALEINPPSPPKLPNPNLAPNWKEKQQQGSKEDSFNFPALNANMKNKPKGPIDEMQKQLKEKVAKMQAKKMNKNSGEYKTFTRDSTQFREDISRDIQLFLEEDKNLPQSEPYIHFSSIEDPVKITPIPKKLYDQYRQFEETKCQNEEDHVRKARCFEQVRDKILENLGRDQLITTDDLRQFIQANLILFNMKFVATIKRKLVPLFI